MALTKRKKVSKLPGATTRYDACLYSYNSLQSEVVRPQWKSPVLHEGRE